MLYAISFYDNLFWINLLSFVCIMTCIRLMWTKIKFKLGYRTPPIPERSLPKPNRVVSYMKHAEDRTLMSSVSKFLAVVMSSSCHVITVQANFFTNTKKKTCIFFHFTSLWERSFRCTSYYIIEILKMIRSTRVSGANAAPCSPPVRTACAASVVFLLFLL